VSKVSKSRKAAQESVSNEAVRRTLEADVQAFLDAGNAIERVPTGFTNQNPVAGRRHIVLGPSRKP
jgi:hypothetical protein